MPSYALTGIMETACGIRLNDDHSFDFYYSYGAADRNGYGTWEEKEGHIILNSSYQDKTGFSIESEKKYPGSGVVVKVENFDKMFFDNTRMFIVNGSETEEQGADREGFFRFTAKTAEKLMISCVFFPDNLATLIPNDPQNNNYTLKVNHDLLLVHFTDVRLRRTEKGLEGNFPLLNMTYGERNFVFREDA